MPEFLLPYISVWSPYKGKKSPEKNIIETTLLLEQWVIIHAKQNTCFSHTKDF